MRISKLTLKNFRCFGEEPTSIDFDDSGFTACIGANASGKTAVLQALAKLFSANGMNCKITKDDFHVPSGKNLLENAFLSVAQTFSMPITSSLKINGMLANDCMASVTWRLGSIGAFSVT